MAKLTPKQKREEAALARIELKKRLGDGCTVYTQLATTSQDGMRRTIKVLLRGKDDIENISAMVAKVIGWRFSTRHNGVIVTGCGMDMGFHLVYVLSSTIYSEEVNDRAGYKLSQRWI
jgi:hypothetical protein